MWSLLELISTTLSAVLLLLLIEGVSGGHVPLFGPYWSCRGSQRTTLDDMFRRFVLTGVVESHTGTTLDAMFHCLVLTIVVAESHKETTQDDTFGCLVLTGVAEGHKWTT